MISTVEKYALNNYRSMKKAWKKSSKKVLWNNQEFESITAFVKFTKRSITFTRKCIKEGRELNGFIAIIIK